MAPTERLLAAGFAGKIVAKRYKLDRMLGAGAAGEVWLAEHIHMRKRFAVKVLDSRIATPEIVARFEREAVMAANIAHPGVVAGTDFGRDEDGSFFLVLEYVAGKSLRALIQDGAVAPARALQIARQILSAVGAAHAKGVVHRDLKPENVMLAEKEETSADSTGRTSVSPGGAKERIKVLDFGIAKLDMNASGGGTNLTRAGAVYGTPTYMAPEQALGETVDGRADLYAIGVILYELITGKPPFEGEPLEVIAHQVNEDAPKLAAKAPADAPLTAELEAFVAALLKRPRADRPADAEVATAMLDSAQRSLTAADAIAKAEPPLAATALETTTKSAISTEKKKRAILFGAGLALFIVIPLVILASRKSPKIEEQPAELEMLDTPPSASAAPSASASVVPSASASQKPVATAPASKKPTGSTKNEKGFGKLKSLFK